MDEQHLRSLLNDHQRRLHILERKEAQMGINTPAEVITELEDIREKYKQLQAQLQREVIRDTWLSREAPPKSPGLILLIGPGRIDQNSLNQSAIDAVEYHSPVVRHCWLIGTDASRQVLEEKIAPRLRAAHITVHIRYIADPTDVQETYGLIQSLYAEEIAEAGLQAPEVIADVTGATKPMSFGMMLACGTSRPIQYMVRQKEDPSVPIMLRYSLD